MAYHVYAKCRAGRRNYLETRFSGSRRECENFVTDRARNGQPTHFLYVSCRSLVSATKAFCDGAIWDAAGVCYHD